MMIMTALTNENRPMVKSFNFTPLSEASDTKRNVIASLSDDAVIHAMHHMADNCLQFQLHPLLFVHLVIVLGFWAKAM